MSDVVSRTAGLASWVNTRWERATWLTRGLVIAAVLGIGALSGWLTRGPSAITTGVLAATGVLGLVAVVTWWREPGKTVLAQMFFAPLLLLAGATQADIVNPVPAGAPPWVSSNVLVTTAPLMLWMLVASVIVHQVPVSRAWLRAVLIVQTAAWGGLLAAMLVGPWGVILGYVLSAGLAYMLTWGWGPLTRQRYLRAVSTGLAPAVGLVDYTGESPADTVLAVENLTRLLPDDYTVLANVRVPSPAGDTLVPILVIGASGVAVVGQLAGAGVLREDSKGVTIGGVSVDAALARWALTADRFARLTNTPAHLIRPVLTAPGALTRTGVSHIALFDGDTRLFDIDIISGGIYETAELIASPREGAVMSDRLARRTHKRALKYTRGTQWAAREATRPLELVATSSEFNVDEFLTDLTADPDINFD